MKARDFAELLGLAALWGMSFLFMRVAVPEFGAVPMTAVRVGGAALFLLPLLLMPAHRVPLRRHWRTIAFVGLIHSALPFMLFAVAALAIDTGLSAIFNATTSMWAALIAWVWLGEPLNRSRVFGLVLGFIGVVGLAWDEASFKPGEHGVSAAVAIAACLGAALCYGFSANYAKRNLEGVPPMLVAAGSQLGAALALALPAVWLWPASPPGLKSWSSVAALAVFCTAMAYILYYRLIAHVGAARASTVTLLVPLFAVVWGAVFLSETLTPAMLALCAVILLGTALTTGVLRWARTRRARMKDTGRHRAAAMSTPPHTTPEHQRHALWAALVLVVIWGANFSVQKAVFVALQPGGFLFLRYLLLPAAAALLLCWHHGLHWPRVPRSDLWALLRLGLAGHLMHVTMVTFGIHWSTPFSSSLILACGPIFTLLILRWHGLETLARAQLLGVAVAMCGALVFLSDKLLGGQWRASGGDLTLLVASAFFAYYTVASKPLIERHGGVLVMTYATLLGSAPVVAISLPAGLAVEWSQVGAWIWAGALWACLVSAFLGWMVWGWVNAVRGVARTAPLMYLMPPVAGLVAWALTGERYGAVKLGGAALTLAGVALAQFGSPARDLVREAPAPVD